MGGVVDEVEYSEIPRRHSNQQTMKVRRVRGSEERSESAGVNCRDLEVDATVQPREPIRKAQVSIERRGGTGKAAGSDGRKD